MHQIAKINKKRRYLLICGSSIPGTLTLRWRLPQEKAAPEGCSEARDRA